MKQNKVTKMRFWILGSLATYLAISSSCKEKIEDIRNCNIQTISMDGQPNNLIFSDAILKSLNSGHRCDAAMKSYHKFIIDATCNNEKIEMIVYADNKHFAFKGKMYYSDIDILPVEYLRLTN